MRSIETISFLLLFTGILFTSFGLNTQELIVDTFLIGTGLAMIIINILFLMTVNKRRNQKAI